MSMLSDSLNRLTDRLARLLFAAGGVLLLAILGLTLGNIILRAMGMPLRGVVEISGFLGAAAVGLCLPRAQRTGSHIEAGMLSERLPLAARRGLQVVVSCLCLGFMALAASEMIGLGLFVHEVEELIDGWDFSYDFLVFALAAGCAVQALVLADDLLQAFVEYTRRPGLEAAQSGARVLAAEGGR